MSVSAPTGLRHAPYLLVGSIGCVTFGYSAVPSLVVGRFDATLVSVGLLMSAGLFGFGIAQFPAGRFFERAETARPLFLGAVVHAALSVALDFAPTFESLLALRFLWALVGGVLVALHPMVTMIAVSGPFGSIYTIAADAEIGDGAALGIVLALGNLAALVFPAVTGAVRETRDTYGAAFILLAATNLVAVGAAFWLGRR